MASRISSKQIVATKGKNDKLVHIEILTYRLNFLVDRTYRLPIKHANCLPTC